MLAEGLQDVQQLKLNNPNRTLLPFATCTYVNVQPAVATLLPKKPFPFQGSLLSTFPTTVFGGITPTVVMAVTPSWACTRGSV